MWTRGHVPVSARINNKTNKKGSRIMNPKKWLSGILYLALAVFVVGCGGGAMDTPPVSQQQSGTMFVTGTDAPLPSVVSFQVDITGMTVSDGVNPPVSVLNGTQTVDFARLNGLRTLLDINTIDRKSTRLNSSHSQISYA